MNIRNTIVSASLQNRRASRFGQEICKLPRILMNHKMYQFVAIRAIRGLCGTVALRR